MREAFSYYLIGVVVGYLICYMVNENDISNMRIVRTAIESCEHTVPATHTCQLQVSEVVKDD